MKEKILKCLREAEDYVSGQELCQMFDVSRTAIWKVMNQLKEEGYVIDAVKNKGYRLVQTPDLVTAEEVDIVDLSGLGRNDHLAFDAAVCKALFLDSGREMFVCVQLFSDDDPWKRRRGRTDV